MPITKSEKGRKRVCENCNTRWYDLNKSPITCPVCNAEFHIENLNNFGAVYQNQNFNKNNKSNNIEELDQQDDTNELNDDNSDDIISLEEVDEEEKN
jgi:uncharacterized protein (TIGR02300 family)